MANLLSRTTGNWLTAGTWGLVDTTSYLNSETGASTCPTSGGASARSAGFTPGAITIDGIAVKLANRTGTTGTLTVELWNNTGSAVVAATTVTINTADLPAAVTANADGGWIVFGFASVLLVAATEYMVQCTTSTASQINLFRDATANNWARMLRTTTTQAPAAGDDMVVSGDFTGAGTSNSFEATMNSTTATDYGSNSTSAVIPAVAVCNKGTLDYAAAAATNYILRLSGHLIVYQLGTFNIGKVSVPMPRNSTAVLEFDCAADGDFGLIARNGSTVNMQGLSRTSGKNVVSCKLNTDEAAAQTVLGVDTDTGWLSGDQIAIASTTRTRGESELRTLSANANASDMTVTAGLTNAHSGTSPTQAEVINITRNVKVRGVTAGQVTFFNVKDTAVVDLDWVEGSELSKSATGQRGIDIETTTGSCNIQFCSLHDTDDLAINMTGAGTNNVTISSNVFWDANKNGFDGVVRLFATTGTAIVISTNIIIKSNDTGFRISDLGGTFTNNVSVSCQFDGSVVNDSSAASITGTCSGLEGHANGGGASFSGATTGMISSCKFWRNASQGLTTNANNNLIFDGVEMFGNAGNNTNLEGNTFSQFRNCVLSGDSTFSSGGGLGNVSSDFSVLIFDTCDFSVTTGIKVAHTTADIVLGQRRHGATILRNCILGAAIEVNDQTVLTDAAFISSSHHNRIAGNHKTWLRTGTLTTDTSIFHTASPSMRMTPINATRKLESAAMFHGLKVAVNNGGTVTINVYTRRSSAGDGAAYTGAQPRLIVKANPALGASFNSDTVLDTHTAADGTWEQLSGTTASVTDDGAVEFVVDCDLSGGGSGWINVDDYSVS